MDFPCLFKKCDKERGHKMNSELQEIQRYGRNKDTIVNRTYINGGEYRKKFDKISDNKKLNRKIYEVAKKMLEHRSGTLYEDMHWIDIDSQKVVASEVNQTKEREIKYSKATKKIVSNNKNLIAVHTHPNSMPPSINDFNSALKHGYQICIICCHDGKIFMYQSNKYVLDLFHKGTIYKYKVRGYNDFDAQVLALKELQSHGDISFKEV